MQSDGLEFTKIVADAADPDCSECQGQGAAFYDIKTMPKGVQSTLLRYAPVKRINSKKCVLIACHKCVHPVQAHGAPPSKSHRHT